MKDNALVIRVSPNKTNIKFVVKKMKNLEESFYSLVEALYKKQIGRVISYCSSIKEVSDVYNYLTNEYTDCDVCIEMYHSETTEATKKKVGSIFRDPKQKFIIIATSALGMGLDIVNCDSVILYGIPKSIVDLFQQVGRVGRNGLKAVAILIFKSSHLSSASEHVKHVYTTKKCRRQEALSLFLTKSELSQLALTGNVHSCCDVCELSCNCGNCQKLPFENIFLDNEASNEEPSEEVESNSDTESYTSSDTDE